MKRDVPLPVVEVGQSSPAGAAPLFGLLFGVFVWLLAWYWPTAASIGAIWWRSETFAHGLAVLPICAWLAWRKRDQLAGVRAQPVAWLALPVALAGFAWLLGQMVAVNALAHFALACMIVGCAAGVLGWHAARVLAFPLLFLFFGVPLGEFLMPTLMAHTATFTVGALRLSGVPVFQEGLHFVVPNGRWSVVEACSGIRYLIASLMVGTLYAYLHYRSLKRRLLFVALAALVPIVANWVRAYLIVMLGYLSDNRIAAGVDHLIYGWLFFGVVILLMFAIGARWREDLQPEPVRAPRPQVAPQPAAARGRALVLLAATTAAFPVLLARFDAPVADFRVELALPGEPAGWAAAPEADPVFRPHYSGQRGELRQTWRRGSETVTLHVAYYAAQRAERELVMWSNRLIAPEARDWVQLVAGQGALPLGEAGEAARVRHAVVGSADERRRVAVWEWYWVDGRVVTSDVHAKALKALGRLSGRPDDAAYVAVLVPLADDAGAAARSAQAFTRAAAPLLGQMLHEARERVR